MTYLATRFVTFARKRALLSLATLPLLVGCNGDDGGASLDTGANSSSSAGTDGSATGWDSTSDGGTTGWDTNGSASDSTGGTGGDTTTGGGTTGLTGGDTGDETTTGDPEDPPPEETTGEMCDDMNPTTKYISPDDSNSMASPVYARDAVFDGWPGISGVIVRPWEFFNYYTFDYPAAAPGELAVTAEMYREADMPEGEYVLQIAVSSEEVTNVERAPINLTLVLDTSGSMSGQPMDLMKESLKAMASKLKAGDTVSMVTWSTSNAVILGGYDVSGPNDTLLMDEIEALEAGGGTNLHGGLVAGYDLASQVYDNDRINRIVLVSDGGANAGITDAEIIGMHAGGEDEDGIYMVGLGVGTAGQYNDSLMDTVTDWGKGAAAFIPDQAEAWKILGEQFVNTMSVAARDVHVQLDLPPGFEIKKFSAEEVSGDPTEVEPQHLAPNDAMVFHQTVVTCAPELVDDASEVQVTVRYKDAITFDPKETSVKHTFGELLAVDAPQLHKGAALFAYTQALKTWREAYGTPEADAARQDALDAVAAAEAMLPADGDLAEIRSVLEGLE